MTPQEIFDTVAAHLFTQGGQALRSNGVDCAYRGQNGTKCAVGCVIPDENYDASIEGVGVRQLPDIGIDWIFDNIYLLEELQDVHDDDKFWESDECLKAELNELAVRNNLSPAVLDGLQFPEVAS